MTWIKEKIYRFKKWLAGLGIISVALAAGIALTPGEQQLINEKIALIQDNLVLAHKTVPITWTDENSNEDIIIKTNHKDYYGFGGNAAYFSVSNVSSKDQNVRVAFSFKNDNWRVAEVGKFMEVKTIIMPEEIIPPSASTSTETIIPSYEKKETVWQKMTLGNFTGTLISRKDNKGQITKTEFSDFLNSGETKYYYADVRYPKEGGEWFIEAFGDKGSYAHLDPNNWTYTQCFNTLTTGGLNGQDSFTAPAAWTVTTSNTYEGAKAITATTGDTGSALRTITEITSGTLYVSMRISGSAETDNLNFFLYDGASALNKIVFRLGGIDARNGAANVTWETYTNGVYARIGFEFDLSTDQSRYNKDNGTWTSWYDNYSAQVAADTIDINASSGNTYVRLLDTILPDYATSGCGGGAAAIDSSYIILFE